MEEKIHHRSVEVKFRSEAFKRQIIEYYLSNDLTKREVWEKFTGKPTEHGLMNTWMKKLGYTVDRSIKSLPLNAMPRKKKHKQQDDSLIESDEIKKLKLRLRDAELKAEAYSKMIDIAEEEFNLPIRKKFNSKP